MSGSFISHSHILTFMKEKVQRHENATNRRNSVSFGVIQRLHGPRPLSRKTRLCSTTEIGMGMLAACQAGGIIALNDVRGSS